MRVYWRNKFRAANKGVRECAYAVCPKKQEKPRKNGFGNNVTGHNNRLIYRGITDIIITVMTLGTQNKWDYAWRKFLFSKF